MKKRMIRLLCAAGVLAAMACGAWALTSPDGLVSLSYLNNTFIPSAVEKGTTAAYNKLQQTYDSAKATLDSLAGKNTSGGSKQEESATLAPKSWGEGDTVTLPTGSGVRPGERTPLSGGGGHLRPVHRPVRRGQHGGAGQLRLHQGRQLDHPVL